MADLAVAPGLLEQIRLVAWLRWRILRNSLRKKSRRLDLLGLVITGLLSTIFVAGVTVAFFVGTKSLLENNHQRYLGLLFLALLVWWQLFPILLAGFTPQFAFRLLLRFPLKLSAFYLIGMAYGLADSAALAALIWMSAMLAATLISLPAAAPVMFLVCLMFAALNVTIERLLGAWVEKLLAKRRSREVFFSVFILAMISLQFLNPIMQKYGHTLVAALRGWIPYLWLLPSSFAGDAVARSVEHQWAAAALKLGALAFYLGLFTVLLWMRYTQLYSGEELSETAAPALKGRRTAVFVASEVNETPGFLPPQILAVFRKELLYLRRNTFLFFGLVFPPMLVLFFSFQFAGAHPTAFKRGVSPDLFFPAMMAYLVLILLAPAYNNFAYEGKGIQTYFTSPTPFREILIAKNLVTALLFVCEIALCVLLVGWRVGLPSTPVLFATLAGMIFSIVGQLTIANWSSLNFPRRMEFGKMQGQRNSGMSVLVIFGVQILFGGVSTLILFSGRWTGSPWLPAEIFSVLAIAALAGYFSSLNAFTDLAEKKKEILIDALCR
jgi:ABC-2 type transport system permease protein